MYDFAFLAPCPSSGIIIHGTKDLLVPQRDVLKLVEKLQAQKGIIIHHDEIDDADHFFENHQKELMKSVNDYLDMRLNNDE